MSVPIFPPAWTFHLCEAEGSLMDLGRLLDRFSKFASLKEPSGIVVHHQRMTPFAFEFLDQMLYNLKYVLKAQFCSLREMVNGSNEKQAGVSLR